MAPACDHVDDVRPDWPAIAEPACEECTDGSWVSLRRCLTCGHVGCCDNSKNKHATQHFHSSGHPIIQSFERGEDWRWCYVDRQEV